MRLIFLRLTTLRDSLKTSKYILGLGGREATPPLLSLADTEAKTYEHSPPMGLASTKAMPPLQGGHASFTWTEEPTHP